MYAGQVGYNITNITMFVKYSAIIHPVREETCEEIEKL